MLKIELYTKTPHFIVSLKIEGIYKCENCFSSEHDIL